MTLEPQSGAQQCGGTAVVGLYPAHGDHGVVALLNGQGQGEFQFADLVAADAAAGHVVAFDPDTRPADLGRESFQGVKGGGRLRQAQARRIAELHHEKRPVWIDTRQSNECSQ